MSNEQDNPKKSTGGRQTRGRPPGEPRRRGSALPRRNRSKGRGHRAPPTDGDLIYGLHSVEAALKNPNRTILRFQATQNAANRLIERFDDGLPVQPEIVTVKEIARQLDNDPVHQGVLIQVAPLNRQDDLADVMAGQLVLALDRITDPHNVGAILRSAVAFNASGVIVTTRHAPQETAVLAKSASGALEMIPLIAVSNLSKALCELKRGGYRIIGLDSEAPVNLSDVKPDAKTVLVLGAEGKGLRHGVREACDHLTRIELPGEIVSLNVSNAAAVSLYALTRPLPKA